MADFFTVNVKGLNEINQALKKIGSDSQKQGGVILTRSGARVLKNSAVKECPVKTGNLVKSIRMKRVLKGKALQGFFQYIVGFTYGKGAKNDGWYARLVEFGTQPHSLRRGADVSRGKKQLPPFHPGSRPNPFMRRAFSYAWDKALKIGAEDYKKFMEKTIKKHSRNALNIK